jgi:hypothetical protein
VGANVTATTAAAAIASNNFRQDMGASAFSLMQPK